MVSDRTPVVGIDEFLRGCLRYRGLATGVDMHTCIRVAPWLAAGIR